MARTRTTKKLAQRIDLNYFKRPTPQKRLRLWLGVALPLLALAWIAWRGFAGDQRVYSSGPLSQAHAVLENQCAACHVEQAGAYSARASDSACLACHDGPVHHPSPIAAPNCPACHTEHRGHLDITAVSKEACASCHGDLRGGLSQSTVAARIHSFERDHPEFAALRAGLRDPGTIKLNHALHLKPIRSGPNGPLVTLECGDCHRPAALQSGWRFADPGYVRATVSYSEPDEILPLPAALLEPRRPPSGRELMVPVKFATACAGCHSLAFDKRFDEGVPHDRPDIIFEFLKKKFSAYITAHPRELLETQNPARELTGRRRPERSHTLAPAEWVEEKISVAEELLTHKTCRQCHEMGQQRLPDTDRAGRAVTIPAPAATGAPMAMPDPLLSKGNLIPAVTPPKTTLRWMPHARFDHDAHRGFRCVSCHAQALTSTESGDLLLPGIAICRTCHAPGPAHADSRCSECHTYHDWSKQKEIRPEFTLPALRTGGP